LKENAEKENPNVAAVAAAAETGEPAPTPVLEKASNSPHAHSEKRQRTPASERLDRPKKAKEASEATAEAGKQYLQMRVAKYFEIESDDGKLENILFKGTVTSYDAKSKYWHIEYDDDVSGRGIVCRLCLSSSHLVYFLLGRGRFRRG